MGREVARQVVEGSNCLNLFRNVALSERGSHTALCHLQVDWKRQITQ